ncbi:Clavaminate synthase-like protein [Mollisia scopiformis]|uniref:Clavaminate synthase-like protein n=1 Tax=Mollisia scopiformis TaxID=149040 RepID=A0A194WX62_MOLSC|nr:Clavaminate synthase-like protein [Mollisia scopiformis]KUJ12177.1 Clavaminate synthase-like protein [Mollisia scopiformis]
MPTKSYFEKLPPFPNDVPVAKLPRISFAKLLDNETEESEALFSATRKLGFFMLDFQDCAEGQSFLEKSETMFEINKKICEMDIGDLAQYAYHPPHSLFGYKKLGDIKIKDGRPDRLTFYNISQDDMTGIAKPMSHPPCVESHRADVWDFMNQAHSIIELICSHLDTQLRLPLGTLASMQPMSLPSGTALRLLQYPPQPESDRRTSLLGHTDIRTLTILFNLTGGFQILLPGRDATDNSAWMYVKPEPGYAIINLGDAMVEWSGGILRSNMHRVTFAPGEQSKLPRYSLAYLVRPDGDAPMKRLGGEGSLIPQAEGGGEEDTMTAREREVHKSIAIQSGKDNARSRGGIEI